MVRCVMVKMFLGKIELEKSGVASFPRNPLKAGFFGRFRLLTPSGLLVSPV